MKYKNWTFIEVLKSEKKIKQISKQEPLHVERDIRKHYEQVLEPSGLNNLL